MKKGAVLGILVVFLTFAGAGGYWLFVHRPNQPTQRYIEAKVVTKLSEIDQDKMLKIWQDIGNNEEVLSGLAKESKVASSWGVSDDSIVENLRKRLFINIDKRRGLQVGFKGKRKETEDLNKLSGMLFNYGAQIIIKNDPEFGKIFKAE